MEEYAEYLESLGLSDEDIVSELARVMNGEPHKYTPILVDKITTSNLTADRIESKPFTYQKIHISENLQ